MKNFSLHSLMRWLIFAWMPIIILISCREDEDGFAITNDFRIIQVKLNGTPVQSGVTDVPVESSFQFVFSHGLDAAEVESALIFNPAADYNLSYDETSSVVDLTFNTPLSSETTYTLSVPAGTYGLNGEEAKEDISFVFTTRPPSVTLSTDKALLEETGEVATVTATLSQVLVSDVTIELSFGGSAENGVDYTASASSLMIAAGQLTATMTLTSNDDEDIEVNETILVEISSITNAVELTPQSASVTIVDNDAARRGFIINELLFDPPTDAVLGDANGDGVRSASEDEFIEFVNDSDDPVDLSGYKLYDTDNYPTTPRHVFPPNSIVPANGVLVLFGGGTPTGEFGGAIVQTSTTGNMNLNNAGEIITITDAADQEFMVFNTENTGINFGLDQSVTRFPDISGNFVLHNTDAGGALYSPGTRVNGNVFFEPVLDEGGLIINELLFDPAGDITGDANGDGARSAVDDEFIEFVNTSNAAIDISGFTVYDATNLAIPTPNHTFPPSTIIPAGGVYVLFGGGTPTGSFGGAQVGVSTSGNLNLTNSAEVITILDTEQSVFLTFDTSVDGNGINFGADVSVSRSPDLTGGFVLHTTANAGLIQSPGTKTDGTNFN